MSKRVAVLLAGGKGSRLLPYTISIPKPLVSVGQYPIAEILVRQLKKNSFTHVFFAVNHLSHLIEEHFREERFGIYFRYYREKKPLSTMGPLKAMQSELPDDFLVMNGDVLTDISFEGLLTEHINNKALFTIASKERTHNVDYGVLHAEENILTGFDEKPDISYLVSMGIYAMNKSVLDEIPVDTFFGFDHLMKLLLQQKKPVSIYKYPGYWNDIGRPDDYICALEEIENLRETFTL